MSTDPFGTAALRDSVLSGWFSSPTRFREDANAEEDLHLGAYRDRLLVELAQNAADAALATGHPGVLRLSMTDGELRAANTGAPLDAAGVAALASLRASAKRGGVGQFGVGFAAVLAVTDAPRVVSTTGGVEFSGLRTAELVGALPELAERAAERGGRVPVLRLVWPVESGEPGPPEGFETEVRLPLRSDVDGAELLAGLAAQVEDLLLSLVGLDRVQIGERVWSRAESGGRIELHGPAGTSSWLVCRDSGELPGQVLARLGAEARPQWTICWAVPADSDGTPSPLESDVLHAPTPTDERLSLPARLIASLPIEPSRRRLLPGPAADVVLAEAARSYPELVERVAPEHRTALVPRAGFPLSEVDDRLRELILVQLRASRWLPAAGEERDAEDLAPVRAVVLDAASPALADLLAGVLPGGADGALGGPEHAKALAALGVSRLGIGAVVAAVTGIDRPPSWWYRLYAALDPLAEVDSTVREELGGLPVPLVDGRTLPGPRGVLLIDDPVAELSEVDVGGLRVVHPDAAHRLLERLGARHGGPAELLDSEPMRDAVERSLDDADSGVDVSGLVDAVLRLVAEVGPRPGEQAWLGALALPDADGEWRRADELALPGSAFLDLLVDDSPIGVLADRMAKAWPVSTLTAVGVLDSFAVVVDEAPAGPDHDLPDEEDWWDSRPDPPVLVLGVRDLDLIADDSWPEALRLLAGDPLTWRALTRAGGYPAWWIGRNAVLAGLAPRDWRLPGATALAGLYDPMPDLGLPERLLEAIGVRTALDLADPDDLLARLGDPARSMPAGVVLRAHAVLAAADPSTVEPPERVRTMAGSVRPAPECAVLDAPWLLGLLPDERLVSAGADFALAASLAEVLDLPVASELVESTIDSPGDWVAWSDLGAVFAAGELLDLELPDGGPVVHDRLTVGGAAVPWWVDGAGVHVEDSADAFGRALAWLTGRWPERHLLAALITDPDARTHLA
ncbi:MAG: sacsin N-terminal ATP-binding-like domain-containing protein [Labedaea sp.]